MYFRNLGLTPLEAVCLWYLHFPWFGRHSQLGSEWAHAEMFGSLGNLWYSRRMCLSPTPSYTVPNELSAVVFAVLGMLLLWWWFFVCVGVRS